MPVIDFQSKELLARARLEPMEAARGCGLKPALVSLCIRGLRAWHPDERAALHDFLEQKIAKNEQAQAAK